MIARINNSKAECFILFQLLKVLKTWFKTESILIETNSEYVIFFTNKTKITIDNF